MTDFRKLARGMPCQVRLPGVCNGNPETTVLAHYRMIHLSGLGMKSPDWCAAWSCSACHDAIDRRRFAKEFSREYVQLAHLQGVLRTQAELMALGKVIFA
jgi:hypothetical protein